MFDSAKLTEDLKREEGCVLHAYPDHLGFATIGIGRLIDKRKGGGISQEEAEYLLCNDIKEKQEALYSAIPWAADLPEPCQRALMNMAFQLGVAGLLEFRVTLTRLKLSDYAGARESALQSKWAQQTPARAARVTALFLCE